MDAADAVDAPFPETVPPLPVPGQTEPIPAGVDVDSQQRTHPALQSGIQAFLFVEIQRREGIALRIDAAPYALSR